MIHNYTGASIKELKKKYKDLFYNQSWYETESFYDEHTEKGEYEIILDRNTCGKTYTEQVKSLPENYAPVHPAIVIEAILEHYKKTGERLLEDWYVRTSTLDSDGYRVNVGYFDAGGLSVYSWRGGNRDDNIGLSAARKLNTGSFEPLGDLNLESAIKLCKENGLQVSKIY